jgi:hypothetical protein
VLETQYINQHSSSFTDCKSDSLASIASVAATNSSCEKVGVTSSTLPITSKEGGVMDFNDSIDSVVATDSNSDYTAASDIDPISSPEKSGITTSVLSITASTSVSTSRKFPARQPLKRFIQNSRQMIFEEIHISAWPTQYSNAYDLFQLSSFHDNGCKFPKISYISLGDKICSQDSSVTLTDYFQYCLFHCIQNFCRSHLNCCSFCGVTSHSFCTDKCSDCDSKDHLFRSCPKLLRWLHDPDSSHHLLWKNVVKTWIISCPPPHFIT